MRIPPRSSSTQMDVEEACATKFKWRYMDGYETRLKSVAMIQGSIIGDAIEFGLRESVGEVAACEYAVDKWLAVDLSTVGWSEKDVTDTFVCVTSGCLTAEAQRAYLASPDTIAGIQGLLKEYAPDFTIPDKIFDETAGKSRKPLKSEYETMLLSQVPNIRGMAQDNGALVCPFCQGKLVPVAWEAHRAVIVRCITAFYRSEAKKKIGQVYSTQRKIELPEERGARPFVCYPDVIADVDGVPTIIDIKTASQPYVAGIEHIDSQLTFEAYSVAEADKVTGPLQVGFLIITTGTESTVDLRISLRTQEDYEAAFIARVVSDRRLQIYRDIGFPMQGKNSKCNWCEFLMLCRIKRGESWLEKEADKIFTQRTY